MALAGAAATVAAPAIVKAQAALNWRMTSFYGPNAYFYSTGPGSAKDLCKRIDEMSNGRIKIQFFGAGELIPANAGFDAVSSGTVEMNYANSYFWTGKVFTAQYFTAAPFGLNFVGYNGWIYDGGGLELWHEVYDRFNLAPLLAGNTGVQMAGWFRKPINSVADLKGLKMRIPGLAGRVLRELGVDALVLPPGDIFPALERGIDTAEFVGPYLTASSGYKRLPNITTRPASTRWRPEARSSSTRKPGRACRPISGRSSKTRAWPATRAARPGCRKSTPTRWMTWSRNRACMCCRCPIQSRRLARGEYEDPRGSERQGSGHQEGGRLLQQIYVELPAVGEI